MFGGLHLVDMLPLIILALLFFGPKRLPEMGSAIGKTIKEFQKSMKDINEPAAPTPAVTAAPQQELAAPPTQPPALPTSAVVESKAE